MNAAAPDPGIPLAEQREQEMEAAAEASPPGLGEDHTVNLEAMSDPELRQLGDDLSLDFSGYTRAEMLAVLQGDTAGPADTSAILPC
jgi:hypothetical protein